MVYGTLNSAEPHIFILQATVACCIKILAHLIPFICISKKFVNDKAINTKFE